MRKVISIILVMLMVLSVAPVQVFAEGDTYACGDSLTYALADNVLTISGSGAMTDYADEDAAPWAQYATSITKVILSDGITRLGNYAFCHFSSVTQFELPSSLEVIGTMALHGCAAYPNFNNAQDVGFEIATNNNGTHTKIFKSNENQANWIKIVNNCTYTDTVVEPKMFLNWFVIEDGYTIHHCDICGFEYTGDVVPAIAPGENAFATENGKNSYVIFNSGKTSAKGEKHLVNGVNPAPETINNTGYDIYGSEVQTKISRIRIGRSIYINDVVTKTATLSINAFDVDEESGEYDRVYLVDDNTHTETLVGTLSGMNQQWNNTSMRIPADKFTVGHTYHFEVLMGNKNGHKTWVVYVRNVNLQMTCEGYNAQNDFEPTTFDASISANGTVSTTLTFESFLDDKYNLIYEEYNIEYSAVCGNYQYGSYFTSVASTEMGQNTVNATFALESGSPKGVYVITAYIKDTGGNVLKTISASAGRNFMAVSYDPNGGSDNLPIDVTPYSNGDSVSVMFNEIPLKEGCEFLGWSKNKNATTPMFTENGMKSFTMGASDVVLYAVWKEDVCTEHIFKSEIITPATCTQDGEILNTCEKCGYQTTEVLHIEHEYYLDEQVDATCTQNGYINYKCANCGDIFTVTLTSSHNYKMEVVQRPTHNQVGIIRYTCTICGDTYTEEISGTGSHVLLVQDIVPWVYGNNGSDNNPSLLNRLVSEGYIEGWELTTTKNFSNVNLDDYEVILIANDQTTATYNQLATLNNAITEFVENGGTVIYGSCDHGWRCGNISYMLPGGVKKNNYYSMHNYIVDHSSHIVKGDLTDNKPLTDTNLYGNYCSHTWFDESTLPTGTNIILKDANGKPTLVEYNLGNGKVIASGLTWEYFYTRQYQNNVQNFSKSVYDDLIVYAMSECYYSSNCHHQTHTEVLEPTCWANGYEREVCDICGAIVKETVLYSTGHDLSGDYTIIEKGTCTTDGLKGLFCQKCGGLLVADIIIPASGHEMGEWVNDDEIRCDIGGTVYRHCTHNEETAEYDACHYTESQVVEQMPHTFGELFVTEQPTCTEEGSGYYRCAVCGEIEFESLPALGHNPSPYWTVETESTCDHPGVKYHECLNCGEHLDVTEIEPLAHIFGEWIIDTPSTCAVKGTRHNTCTVCGYVKTQEIDYLEHTYTEEWFIDLEPGCDTLGLKSHHCTVCGHINGSTTIEPLGHDYADWVYDVQTTCTEPGVKHRECSRCNYVETVNEDAFGHDFNAGWIIEVSPTCTSNGRKAHICSRCALRQDVTTIAATGHSFGEWTITEATSTQDGKKERTCDICGYKETVTIPYQIDEHTMNGTVTLPSTSTVGTTLTPNISKLKYGENTITDENYVWYKWYRNGVYITGGSSAKTYTIQEIDLGQAITVEAIAPWAGVYSNQGYHGSVLSNICSVKLGNVNNFYAVCMADGVDLTWDPVDGATSYYVYRKLATSVLDFVFGAPTEVIAEVNTTHFLDETALKGKMYVYGIVAKNDIAKSAMAKCPVDYSNEYAALHLEGVASGYRSITLTWDTQNYLGVALFGRTADGSWERISCDYKKDSNSTDYDSTISLFEGNKVIITSNSVQFGNNNNSTLESHDANNTALFNKNYEYYAVRGYAKANTFLNSYGPLSNEVHLKYIVAPSNLTVTQENCNINIQWKKVSLFSLGTSPTDYEILRNGEVIATIPYAGNTTYTYTDHLYVNNGGCYRNYTVRGVYDEFRSAEISESIIATVAHAYGPGIDDVPATCTQSGSAHRICQNCGFQTSYTVPAKGHSTKITHLVPDPMSNAVVGAYTHQINIDVECVHTVQNGCNTTDETTSFNGITVTLTTKDMSYGYDTWTWREPEESIRDKLGLNSSSIKTITITNINWSRYMDINGDWITDTSEYNLGEELFKDTDNDRWRSIEDKYRSTSYGYITVVDGEVDWTVDVEPTCIQPGSKSHHCVYCGLQLDVTSIPAGGHHYGDDLHYSVRPTCTEPGELYKECTVCGERKTVTIPALGHWFSDKWTVDVEPTCTQPGLKSHHCSSCDAVQDETVIPALGHDYSEEWTVDITPTCTRMGEKSHHCTRCDERTDITPIDMLSHDYYSQWFIDVEATCTADGEKSHHCKNCDDRIDITVMPATGHSYSDWVVTTEAGCETEGERCKTCENCGDVITEVIPSGNHAYSGWTVSTPATCTENGLKTRTCATCDKVDSEVIPALGHNYSTAWTVDQYVTCTEDGLMSHHCTRCSARTDETVVPCEGHAFGGWIVADEATCEAEGTIYRDCEVCGFRETQGTEPAGHHYSNIWTVDVPATCTEPGIKSHHCLDCDARTDATVIAATGHNYSGWTVDTEATCTEEGLKIRTCADCDATESEAIAALGHDYSTSWTVDTQATCTEQGLKSHHCTRCSAKTEETVIPATGHSYSAWAIDTEATCTENGLKTRTCATCEAVESETIPALGHNYSTSWTVDQYVTCTENGLMSHHCTRCSARTDETVVPCEGHAFGGWLVADEATCEEEGTIYRECEVCGFRETQGTEPTGHHYSTTWTVDVPATCTEPGIKSHHCLDCDARTDATRIAPIGHSYSNWVIDTEATCTEPGSRHRTCDVCSETETGTILATGHTYSTRWAIDVEPTCLAEGEKSHHCLYCEDRTDVTVIPTCGHVFGPWYIETEATADAEGVKAHDCYNCDLVEREAIPKLAKYKATFVADGTVVAVVDFPSGATEIEEPEVPHKSKYEGEWEYYELHDADITVHAEYVRIPDDNINEIETDNETGYFSTGEVEINISATSPSKNIVSTTITSVPLDIVLVLDQSGSMAEGGKKQALVNAVNSFSNTVLNDAIENGVDHRIAIVGFSMGNSGGYSGNEYIPMYCNTNVLTTGGNPVLYNAATSQTYHNALVNVNDNGALNAAITTAVSNIDAKGATMANYGLEMAAQVFANNDSTGRQRIVVFLTDGEPTSQSSFEFGVANTALDNAYQLKTTYNANIYSVGIFDNSTANNRNVNNFMNYISSNYAEKHTLNKNRYEITPAPAGFYLTTNNTSELNDIFVNIAEESVITTAMFDNLSFVYTLSSNFSMTSAQEDALRVNATAKYGIDASDITVTRNADGTTKIMVAHINPKFTNGKYAADLTFRATANEKTRSSGTYAINTLDSGVLIENATEYEAVFEVSSIDIQGTSGIAVFNINGIPYEIDRLKSTDYVMAPDTNFGDDMIFSGWNIPADTKLKNKVAIYDATLTNSEYLIKWNIDGVVTTVSVGVGDVIEIPNVTANSIGEDFIGWDNEVPYTMPAQDLEFNATYGTHYHNYDAVTDFTDCTQGGTIYYTCECGDHYTETIEPHNHSFVAYSGVASDEHASQVGFRCTECGMEAENVLDYQQTGTVADNSDVTRQVIYNFSYVDENGAGEQPDGNVNISVSLDDAFGESMIDGTSVLVYRINDDGTMTDISSQNDGAYVTFETNHFSTYVFKLVGGKTEANLDINGDGVFDPLDYAYLLGYIMGTLDTQPTESQLIIADVNDDGVIDAFDLSTLDLYLNKVKALP